MCHSHILDFHRQGEEPPFSLQHCTLVGLGSKVVDLVVLSSLVHCMGWYKVPNAEKNAYTDNTITSEESLCFLRTDKLMGQSSSLQD